MLCMDFTRVRRFACRFAGYTCVATVFLTIVSFLVPGHLTCPAGASYSIDIALHNVSMVFTWKYHDPPIGESLSIVAGNSGIGGELKFTLLPRYVFHSSETSGVNGPIERMVVRRVVVPLPFMMLVSMFSFYLLKFYAAYGKGACSACGYDLRGSVSAKKCPECGHAKGAGTGS